MKLCKNKGIADTEKAIGWNERRKSMSARAFGVNKKNTALRTIAPATVAEKIIGFGTLTICIVATVLGKIYL